MMLKRDMPMIHIFNRKELWITWNIKELAEIRGILAANGIAYRIITRSHARNTGNRAGVVGLHTDAMYQYYIYVKKDDYENARYLINQ